MKTLNYFVLTLFSICMIAACDVSQVEEELPQKRISENLENIDTGNKWASRYKKEVPFVVKFFSEGGVQVPPSDNTVAICGEPQPPILLNIQEGNGLGTYLGKFTYSATFCIDATDLLDDGVLTGDESVPYFTNENTTSVMVAENGDKLFIGATRGAVLPATTPGFDFEFHNPFIITGGTGRFEGAKGKGISSGLVTQSPERTEHIWTGKIKLKDK